MDCRTHERGVGMLNTPYVKKDTIKNFFPVPNAVFDLGLHHMEISIYAYLLRIEDRRTYEGYEVIWTDTRKHITFVCPDGRRCRDSSLHDETFLKENLETLFAYRQAVGFRPNTPEPEEGWMGELASELVRLGRSIEEADDLPPLPAPPAWTESKQRHREALKKLALGQKLSRGQSWQQTMW